ncbi:MAG: tail fiber domain-containing protein [Phycisphaerales bacterium]|nr:tail fiber domain-containing protein [Phycisphaerales bacterium]
MNTIRIVVAIIALLPTLARAQNGTPATNAFSFQGQLNFEDRPANVALDLTFQLFSSPTGNTIQDVVSPQLTRRVQFDDRGRFTVLLDFGQTFNGYPVFNGDERYMQIVILDPPGGIEEDFPLSPRVKLAATPMAAYALNARIPSLSEISNGLFESIDEEGSLAINVLDDDLGLTIRPNGGVGALFSYSGIQAAEGFGVSAAEGDLDLLSAGGNLTLTSVQKNITLSAGQGNIDLIAGNAFSLINAASDISLDSSGFELNTSNIDLNASISLDLSSSAVLSLSSGGVLNISSVLTTINGNQFDGVNFILNDNLLATANAFKPGGGPWSVLSDARQKKNIAPLHGSLSTLLSLRPITYEYNDPTNPMYLPGTQTGFVAQEIRKVLPEWIDESPDGTLLLTPRGFEAMVVDAMQELEQLHAEQIQSLQRENDELRARLERLERLIMSDR